MNVIRNRVVLGAVAAVGAISLLLTGCAPSEPASDPSETSGTSRTLTVGPDETPAQVEVEFNQEAFDLLPEEFRDSKALVVGLEANAGYPNSVTIDGKMYGLTYDLANALGVALGVNVQVESGAFPTLIPGLQSGRFDVSTSLYFDREERREILDLVDAMLATNDLFVLGPATDVGDMTYETACGYNVGVIAGGSYVERLDAASTACVENGEPAIEIAEYASSPEALVAVQSGRIDGMVTQSAQAMYMAKSDETRLRLGSESVEVVGYTAIALPKGSELVPAVRQAMLSLNDSGAWKEILAQYGAESAAPSNDVINNLEPYGPNSPR